MGSSARIFLRDGSYVDWSISTVQKDEWRPHGVKYRLAWVENGRCRVLFDNHRGKSDHLHIDGNELPYTFRSVEALWHDFRAWVVELGGAP